MKKRFLITLLALAASLLLVPALTASAAGAEDAAAAEETAVPEPAPEPVPDPEGTVSFENLDSRVRDGGLRGLALTEHIAAWEDVDYDNILRYFQSQLDKLNSIPFAVPGIATAAIELQDQIEDLKDGTTKKDYDDIAKQFRYAQDVLVLSAEELYVGIAELDAGLLTIQRNLDLLDNTVQEMELRNSLNQISSLALEQAYASRVALISRKQTLDTNNDSMRYVLKMWAGAPMEDTISLARLPEIPMDAVDTMDLEKDMETGRTASYTLYAAEKTLEDAREDWKDLAQYASENSKQHFRYVQGQHEWNAAQYTYQNTVQDFERRFRTLYLEVKDDVQVLTAAKYALALEQTEYRVEQLKYELGNLPANKLASAKEEVDAAQDAADTAWRSLFSSWNRYRWATDHGVLLPDQYSQN